MLGKNKFGDCRENQSVSTVNTRQYFLLPENICKGVSEVKDPNLTFIKKELCILRFTYLQKSDTATTFSGVNCRSDRDGWKVQKGGHTSSAF